MNDIRESGPSSGADDAGFVLVGVVMFILVLTILGLSLFSLSGFEAQFFNASLHRQESYYTATGGIERAKWVLTRTNLLENVKLTMPDGVLYTTARQGPDFDSGDSLGALQWSGQSGAPPDPVWIRVLATDKGVKSYVEARFDPSEPEQIYRRVVTSYTGITNFDATRSDQAYLSGAVWQNSSDLTWQNIHYSGTVQTGSTPMPDVLSFYAAYLNAPGTHVAPVLHNPPELDVSLDSGTPGGPPVFYRTTGLVTNNVNGGNNHFYVRGTAVWMVPDGIDLRSRVTVEGGPSDRLIIVARAIAGKNVGISLDAVIHHGTPIILVSDSGIEFKTDWNSTTISTNISYITMFGNGVTLMGPEVPQTLKLSHDSNLDDAVLEPLYDVQALPNTLSGAGRTLNLHAGTWRQLPTTGL